MTGVLGFQLAYFLILIVVLGIAGSDTPGAGRSIVLAAVAIGAATLLLLGTWAHFVDRIPFREYGVLISRTHLAQFLAGVLLGLVLAKSHILILILTGTATVVEVSGVDHFSWNVVRGALAESGTFLTASVVEEIVYRAQPLRRFNGAHPVRIANRRALLSVTVASIWFTATHAGGPDWPWSAISIFSGGLLYGVLYLITGNIWLSAGLHFAHNLGVQRILQFESNVQVWLWPVEAVLPLDPWKWTILRSIQLAGPLFVAVVLLAWKFRCERRPLPPVLPAEEAQRDD